jgi:hypothetical protein
MVDKKKTPQEQEPKVKMYRLQISLDIEAESIDGARNEVKTRIAELLKMNPEKDVQRVVRAKYSSRADRLAEALSKVNDAVSEIESLKDECQQWYDNLPENFQNGDKGSVLQDAVSALEELQSNLESAASDGESVEFPGMFG